MSERKYQGPPLFVSDIALSCSIPSGYSRWKVEFRARPAFLCVNWLTLDTAYLSQSARSNGTRIQIGNAMAQLPRKSAKK
jgi:hypothetical protein